MSEQKKKLSVAEILAAARKASSGEAAAGTPAPEPQAEAAAPEAAAESAASPPAEAKPAPAKPAAKPAAGGARPSVSDILAMARAKQDAGGEAPAEKPKPAPKPAAAKPAAASGDNPDKPAAAKAPKPAPAKAGGAGPLQDTQSILAQARQGTKSGPMSKAEAAAKGQPEPAAKPARPTAPPAPAKPEYAKKKAAPAANAERRGFLALMVGSFLGLGFTALSLTNGLFALGTARFMFPNILTEPPSRFKVGFPADFAPGGVETKFVAQFGAWVVNGEYQGQQMIYALRTVCTHLGCTPNWLEGEQKFKCPCHGSGFYKDGINFEGPAPRPLERYAIRLADDGQLEVDKSKLFQEEMGQWSDPACFVSV